jgi:sentrin-specific protease 1
MFVFLVYNSRRQISSHLFLSSFFLLVHTTTAPTKPFASSCSSSSSPGKDVYALDKVFFPICFRGHWTLAVAFVQERRLQYYDSLGDARVANGGDGGLTTLRYLERYFHDEHWDKKGRFDPYSWTLVPHTIFTVTTPQQWNGVDCAVFVSMFIDFLSRDRPLTFTQYDIINCRFRIAYSIITGRRPP